MLELIAALAGVFLIVAFFGFVNLTRQAVQAWREVSRRESQNCSFDYDCLCDECFRSWLTDEVFESPGDNR